jgi:hypothetical protein
MMGTWNRLGDNIFIFLDWLAPRSGLRWIDIGRTELLVERCAPAEV